MTQTVSNAIDWPSMLETHKPWLAKVLHCRIGDGHAVDDLLQEIALAVIRQSAPGKRPSSEPLVNSAERSGQVPIDPEKVAPWLYRIAVRQAVNFHRRTNRKSHPKPMAELETFCPTPLPLDGLLAVEEQQQFRDALRQLTPAQREILTLKYTENWSYQQLADHLGIPLRSVEYRLLQARTELRKHLTVHDGYSTSK